ncbi:aminotransferase class I/II-fold pyridoxal phosphate-dependent enzyme [Gramella sp. BOM4]|nr:aminotransferase class I/II-fold pyridoxal phosphate-dependent enzyme [Christiangramia bathymodioli]
MNRRTFLNSTGLFSIPLMAGLPATQLAARKIKSSTKYTINFILEGHFFSPKQYIQKLSEIENEHPINGDFYSQGGVVATLEEKFKKITGKESAIYMPSGTMANEVALNFLSGKKTKAIVHEESHIYRDEGDSAQAIHNIRLVPIKTTSQSFSLGDLKTKIEQLEQGESFYNGIGALFIECPVRRHHGKRVDFNQMKEITEFAHSNNIRTHLDGARIHMASTYSGISVKQYASIFGTIYISLYKYLGAAGGAMLCGPEPIIAPMRHYIKILGGTVFRNWTNAAVANYLMDGLEDRLQNMKSQSEELMRELNTLEELSIEKPTEGTNIVFLRSQDIDLEKFSDILNADHGILINYPENRKIELHFNESILLDTNRNFISLFKDAIRKSK